MKSPIIILHGWAKNGKEHKYDQLVENFQKMGYKVHIPDLPGFGENKLKKEALTFDDYVSFVKKYINKVSPQQKVILIGHSFGGRIAIRFTSLYPHYVRKLILTGASGIPRPLPSIKKKIIYYTTKIVRPLFMVPPFSWFYRLLRKAIYYAIGEMDYYDSSSLKQTFLNVYKISIVADLEKIEVPTLLLWGEKDMITPLTDGEYMHDHIIYARLIVIKEATHKLPYEKPERFATAVKNFIT